ncbi:MAG: S-layer homology domain-containing protein [Firmicutes bacterium]|nr:S-layer homology domain-containing protein [Bacillota bacterium]
MLVTVLYRYEGSPSVEGLENPFKDVPAKEWYTDAVLWAASNGIVNGTGDGKFSPEDNITREQVATIFHRYNKVPAGKGDLTVFPDAGTVDAYAVDAMKWAVGEGIINGSDGKLDPLGNATRAQIAAIFYRYITK